MPRSLTLRDYAVPRHPIYQYDYRVPVTSAPRTSRRRRRAGRISAWVFGGILLAAAVCAVWIGIRGSLAYQHLESASEAAAEAPSVLADPSAAPALIRRIADDTSAARALTGDAIWKAGEHVPWIGPQLAAVSTVSAALDDIASHALTPLSHIAATSSLDSIRPKEGVIDLAPFTEIVPAAATSADALAAARETIGDIDPAPLISPVRAAVAQVSDLVTGAHEGVDALRRASALAPSMLGVDGPRDYLVVLQNNAEWRSLGGIAGAMLQLHVDGGRLTLVTQSSSSDFPIYADPVLPLSEEETQLFGTQPGRFVQNVTQIPDFTRGAPVAREMWLRQTGVEVDGVIALDPVALSYLLAATGPVTLPTGDVLTGENAVDLLLSGVYERYREPREQDAFFAASAGAVFDALASGAGSPASLLEALARAGSEHRVLVWNQDPAEQSVLDGTTLQGALPETDATTTAFGVYVNDATSSKMDIHQTLETQTTWWCGADQAQTTVTIRNTAPADAADLPSYVTGGGSHGVPPGQVKTAVYVYLPQGSTLLSTDAAGDAVTPGIGSGVDAGRDVLLWTVQLAPGQTATLTVRVRTPHTPVLLIRVTPTIGQASQTIGQRTPTNGQEESSAIAQGCDIPG